MYYQVADMGSQSGTASVIAKLMGLDPDDQPNQHPISKRGRVLSESYFQRVASIAVRERSPSPEKYLSITGTECPEELGAFFKVVGKPRKDKLAAKEVESQKLQLNNNVKSRRSEKTCNGFESFSEPPHIPTKIGFLRPCHGVEVSSSKDFSWLRSSQTSGAVQVKCRDSSDSSRYHRDSYDGIELLGQRPRVSTEEVEEVSKQVKFRDVQSMSTSNGSLVSSSSSSYIALEAKKDISERFMITKEFLELGMGSRGKTLGEMLSMHSQRLGPRFVHESSRDSGRRMKNDTHDSNRFKRSKLSQQQLEYNPRDISYNQGHQPFEAGDLSIEKAEISGSTLGASTSLSEILGWSSRTESVSLLKSSNNPPKQEESSQFIEEDSVSTHSSAGSASYKSFEETYHPSPDSVLEHFNKEIPSDQRNDLAGVNDIPFKVGSLGMLLDDHRMTISSDEEDDDNGDCSSNNSKEADYSVRFSKAVENRDFLYLLDVLSEAGLLGGNLTQNLVKWHSTESPVGRLVFEVLEKKYGEQKSWRSERKLLFDRLNLGLTSILIQGTSTPSWAKPASTLVNCRLGTEVTGEALWDVLVRQETEARKDSKNVLGNDIGWSDVAECIDLICREIEESLIEELAPEYCIW